MPRSAGQKRSLPKLRRLPTRSRCALVALPSAYTSVRAVSGRATGIRWKCRTLNTMLGFFGTTIEAVSCPHPPGRLTPNQAWTSRRQHPSCRTLRPQSGDEHTKEKSSMQRLSGRLAISLILLWFACAPTARAQQALVVQPLAERKVTDLPTGELFWRIENYPSRAEAQAAAGDWSLVAESAAKVWLSPSARGAVIARRHQSL